MRFGYSATKNAFYFLDEEDLYRVNGFWSEDIIPVTDKIWCEYASQPPQGKQRGADEKGFPAWVDLQESEQKLSLQYTREKEDRLDRADAEVRRLNIVSEVYELNQSEQKSLADWKKYLADVYRTKPSNNASFEWPKPPDAEA